MENSKVSIRPEDLIAAGFTEKTYRHPEGIFYLRKFYRRKTRIIDMPEMSKKIEYDTIFPEDIVITQVTPDGDVHSLVYDSDNDSDTPFWCGNTVDSDEGQALLRDCLAAPAYIESNTESDKPSLPEPKR